MIRYECRASQWLVLVLSGNNMLNCDEYRGHGKMGRNTVSLLREVHCHGACFL
jgi:hypothetical protein